MDIVIYICSPYFPLPIPVQDSRQIYPITVLSIPRCFYFVPVTDDVLCNISGKRNRKKSETNTVFLGYFALQITGEFKV
jgi:hypothetical protein